MRKLMWFTIGFTMACGLWAYGTGAPWLLPSAAAAAAVAVIALCISRQKKLLLSMLAVLLGCLVGLGWFGAYRMVFLSPVMELDGKSLSLTVTATDYSYDTDYGVAVDGVVKIDGKPYLIRAYLNEDIQLQPGDIASGEFRVRVTLPDEDETSTYLQGKGIFLLAYQQEELVVAHAETSPWWCFPAALRRDITQALDAVFPGDTAPFAKALLLGDGRDLGYETDTVLRVSGIRHIIAVSGLHISILYSLISVVTLRRRFLTAAVGMPVLLLFSAVAGFTPSVTRACIMVWLMLLAMVFEREYDPPTALAFAVLIMLLVNPLAVTSASLQMSVACVAGILLFNQPISSWLKEKISERKGITSKFRGMFCSSVSVSVSAMSLVTPISACYFGAVSLIGVVTNLMTLWVVNLIFNGLVIVCLLCWLLPGVAAILAALLSWSIRFVLLTAKALASLPLAAVYTQSPYILIWLIFVYCLLAVFLFSRNRKPGVLICCGVLGLCMALLGSWLEPLTADTSITMLDVGQGQSILLQCEGKTFLVDCGGDDDAITSDIITETLLSQGISRLDGIILTHYDRDHSGALHNLLTRIDTKLLFLPDTRNELELPDFDGETVYVWEDLVLSVGDARLTVFGPIYSGADNENSLCVLFDTEKCDILITGDRSSFGERMLMRRTSLPDVDILVAGHHGAADATSEELLDTVTPETVLISVAQDNIYGHPSGKLLQRLQRRGIAVYRTDLNGTITIRR